jgi:hypothetical protein
LNKLFVYSTGFIIFSWFEINIFSDYFFAIFLF